MTSVVLLDPASENSNAGDEIIRDAILAAGLVGLGEAPRVTTHRLLRPAERSLIATADLVAFGGSNAVSSHMERFRQWLVDPHLAHVLSRKLVYIGVGWWQYQDPPCAYTRFLLRRLSHPRVPHATRDEYTHRRFRSVGLSSVMTACPTTWSLAPSLPSVGSSQTVVATITDYYQSADVDRRWLGLLKSRYETVRVVGMGPGDEDYFTRDLSSEGLSWAGAGTEVLRDALVDADFVGTRLHAGIRALELGRPALVLAVDNRASEFQKSISLPVVPRNDVDGIRHRLDTPQRTMLQLPTSSIESWRKAFNDEVSRVL